MDTQRETNADIRDRDARLIRRAQEYKRGLLTDEDYTDQVVEIVLTWLVKEERKVQ